MTFYVVKAFRDNGNIIKSGNFSGLYLAYRKAYGTIDEIDAKIRINES